MSGEHNANIGLIGLGYWGKNILRNLYELKRIYLACDSDLEVIKERKKEFPGIDYIVSHEDVLTNPTINAVVISTPAATHYELVKEALNAGKDVFIEKPLALNYERGRELVDLAKSQEKILMVGHILQYHPAVVKLKELVTKGELGKVEYIYSNRLNIGKLRVEENILWSFAPHDISIILMIVGEEPVKINCFGGDYLNENIFDVTLTTLEFRNEMKAHIFVSWLHPFKEQKLIVVGSKAMAVFDDLTKEKLFVYPHKIEWENGKIPVAYKAQHYTVGVQQKEPLKEELKHFLECVETRKTPKTDGEEGLKVLKILEEAEKSMSDRKFSSRGSLEKKYFVHPSSFVDDDAEIGEGSQVWHFSHILKGSKVGKNCKIGQNVVIGPKVSIGNACKIQNNVSIYEGVTLEDSVFCGPSSVFTNVFNPRSEIPRMNEIKLTRVKKGATIGANATVVCGNTLGKYCFIGAGAVVTKDVADYALVYGNPAKINGWMCECGVKLEFKKLKATCNVCKKEYIKKKDRIERVK